jgi:upstream-binding transcription factor
MLMQLVGQEKREAEALKLLHEEQSKKQGQELLEQYLAYKKVTLDTAESRCCWFHELSVLFDCLV